MTRTDQTLARVTLRYPTELEPQIDELLKLIKKDPKFRSIFVSKADVLRMCLENGVRDLQEHYRRKQKPEFGPYDR